MKKIGIVLISLLLLSLSGIAQSLIVNPQNSDKEGGEITLMNSNANYNDWRIDNHAGSFRLFHSGTEYVKLQSNGNFGIGTTNPQAKLEVTSASIDELSTNQYDANLIIKGTQSSRSMAKGAVLGFVVPANTDGGNPWQQGRVMVTPDNQTNANASGRMLLQTRYLSNGAWRWRNNLTLKSTGNVGIGTTNPSFALDVSGTSEGIKLGNSTQNLLFRNNIGGANEIRSYGLALEIETRGTHDISFNSNNGNSKLMTIKGDGSGIGIGTTNPNSQLHIRNANGTGTLIVQGKQDATIGNSSEIILSTEYSTANITSGPQTGRKAIIKAVSNSTWGSNTRLGFYTSSNLGDYPVERMSVSPDGNVGIGTTDTKGYKLGVKGKIAAEEIKVALYNAWPDFVFENNYKLPTLQEVEHHIAKKGHLENIPSAAEVAENGIQLGEMNAKLLQKIEELTLYMIEQNKKTEQLQEENKQLKSINSKLIELQTRIDKLETKK